ARLHFQRRGDEAVSLAGLPTLVVEHAEQVQGVEIVALVFQHARIELFRLVEAALLMQRERLADRLSEVERAGSCAHSRLIRAIRRVTPTGGAASAAFLSGSATPRAR